MKRTASLLVLLAIFNASGEEEIGNDIDDIIDKEGYYLISDGSSCFLFRKDGSFESGPQGVSGRHIAGTWAHDQGGAFTIRGNWGWLNGLSPKDDIREMEISVYPRMAVEELPDTFYCSVSLPQGAKVSKSYFFIDRLVRITSGDSKK